MKLRPPKIHSALLLVTLAAAGGISATIALGDDPPSAATFKTVDGPNIFSLVSGTGASSTSASIVTGGTVTFTNSSSEMHDVDFDAPAAGVSCQQVVGGPSASPLRFPSSPTAGTWSGTCTFSQAGTYSFMCDVHDGMTGTVVVSAPGAPPGTTTAPPVATVTAPVQTTTTPTTTTPTATTPSLPAPSTPSVSSAPTAAQVPKTTAKALAFKIGLTQRGTSVRGAISGAKSSARVKIALTAKRRDTGLKGKAAAAVGVGNLSALTTKAGALSFVVKLNGAARLALAKHHRLALSVLVSAPSASGAATSKTFKIVVRPAST